jgi:DUF1680 family protein
MLIRKVICNPKVEDNKGKYAIERGPLVYCVEADDSSSYNFQMTEAIRASDSYVHMDGVRIPLLKEKSFTAIPYFLWGNSDKKYMRVWLG